ncbi:MAG: TlpA disulfide reductase family protein [Bdellovibrionia bacterium]
MARPPSESEQEKKPLPWTILVPLLGLLLMVIGGLQIIQLIYPPEGPSSARLSPSAPAEDPSFDQLKLTQLDGSQVQLSRIPGKIFLINFWASWCDACMEEMPSIVALRNQFHDQGFEVLAIDVDEGAESIAPKVISQFSMPFPVFQDPNGDLAERFNVHAIPLTVIMRRNGKILLSRDGGHNWNSPAFHQQLTQWLREGQD